MSDDATKDIADVKRYIRTYANDLAKASGAAPPDDAKHPSYVPQKPEPKSAPAPVAQATPPASTTSPNGPVELDALTTSSKGVSQFAPPTPAPTHTPDASREEVLNRLRARVATYQKPAEAATTPELAARPAPAAPPPTPAAPSADPFREPIPTMPPVRSSQVPVARPVPPPPAQAKRAAVQKEVPETGHTFSSDFKRRAEHTGANTFSVLAAEANKKEREAPKPLATKKPSIVVPLLMGLLALSLAGAGVYAVYALLTSDGPVPVATEPSSLLFADEETLLQGPDYKAELAQLAREPLPEGTILITKAGGEPLVAVLLAEAPDLLLRNISPESAVGIVDADTETRPFFALKVGSYERTFAGMLAFEPELLRVLGELYPAYQEAVVGDVATASTTEASTESTPPFAEPALTTITPTTFTDAVVANHDVRVLRDEQGRSLVLYGYANKNLLIIARDEFAFSELLSRVRP